MTACDQTQSYLEKFLGGAASPEQVASFETHSAGCSPCHSAFARAAEFDTMMKAAVPGMAGGFHSPREAVLHRVEVGAAPIDGASVIQPYRVPRWRAVRWSLMLGFVATLAITFEGIASVAFIQKKARRTQAELEVRVFHHFIHQYHAQTRALPASGNTAMVVDLMGHWRKPGRRLFGFPFEADRLVDSQALDPWGRPYVYESDGGTFNLYSVGENGRDDQGEGDDVRWDGTWTAGAG